MGVYYVWVIIPPTLGRRGGGIIDHIDLPPLCGRLRRENLLGMRQRKVKDIVRVGHHTCEISVCRMHFNVVGCIQNNSKGNEEVLEINCSSLEACMKSQNGQKNGQKKAKKWPKITVGGKKLGGNFRPYCIFPEFGQK